MQGPERDLSESPRLHLGSRSHHHFPNVGLGTVCELSRHLTMCNYLLHYSTNALSPSAGRQADDSLSCVTGVAAPRNKVFLHLASLVISVPALCVAGNGLESLRR